MKTYRSAAIILFLILSFLLYRISKLDSSITYYIYEPESRGVFLQNATASYGVGWRNILNPFVKIEFIPNGFVEYRGTLPEIQASINYYNTLIKKNHEDAVEFYFSQFHIDIENIITSSTFNYKETSNSTSFLPKEWAWLTKHKIDETDITLIDFVVLEESKKTDSDVIYYPNCLLIRGEMARLLNSKHYGHFKEISRFKSG